jgi:hypothetical protein
VPATEKDADIAIPSKEGKIRYLKTVALQKLKRVVIEAEDVVTI